MNFSLRFLGLAGAAGFAAGVGAAYLHVASTAEKQPLILTDIYAREERFLERMKRKEGTALRFDSSSEEGRYRLAAHHLEWADEYHGISYSLARRLEKKSVPSDARVKLKSWIGSAAKHYHQTLHYKTSSCGIEGGKAQEDEVRARAYLGLGVLFYRLDNGGVQGSELREMVRRQFEASKECGGLAIGIEESMEARLSVLHGNQKAR
jgi:hypothetical protein